MLDGLDILGNRGQMHDDRMPSATHRPSQTCRQDISERRSVRALWLCFFIGQTLCMPIWGEPAAQGQIWTQADTIVGNIAVPTFPDRELSF